MTLELSDKQFDQILKLAHIGDLVINGNVMEEEVDADSREALQFLYQKAFDSGRKHLKADEETGLPVPDTEWDMENYNYLDDCIEDSFWDKLSDILTDRDLVEQYGEDALKEMSQDELFDLRLEGAEKYDEEFEKNGIARIRIQK